MKGIYDFYACEGTSALKRVDRSLTIVEGGLSSRQSVQRPYVPVEACPLDDKQVLGCLLGAALILGMVFASWALMTVM